MTPIWRQAVARAATIKLRLVVRPTGRRALERVGCSVLAVRESGFEQGPPFAGWDAVVDRLPFRSECLPAILPDAGLPRVFGRVRVALGASEAVPSRPSAMIEPHFRLHAAPPQAKSQTARIWRRPVRCASCPRNHGIRSRSPKPPDVPETAEPAGSAIRDGVSASLNHAYPSSADAVRWPTLPLATLAA